MPVEVESADTVYRAVFSMIYKVPKSGASGTAKSP
jgi:hypothetical protein